MKKETIGSATIYLGDCLSILPEVKADAIITDPQYGVGIDYEDLARWYRDPEHPERLVELNALFNAPLRIQREACEAAGRFIPMVQENVKGAQPWVGRARWNFGSFYLWGDVPALMPIIAKRSAQKNPGFRFDGSGRSFQSESVDRHIKNSGGSWFNVAHNTTSGCGQNPDGRKVPTKLIQKRDGHRSTAHLTNPDEHIKLGGSWFHGYRQGQGPRNHGSKSKARKAASAAIAKIPFALAQHIARAWKPQERAA